MKRAQLQIGESMMVIIILMIVGVIALVFYFNMAKEDYRVKSREYDDLDTLETAQIVSNLYELKCAKPGVSNVCFDIHKAQSVAALRGDGEDGFNDYYYYLFRNSKVALTQYYPSHQELIIYWQNASAADNVGNNPQSVNTVVIPVIIHNSSAETNGFGVLTVERYFR